MEPNNKKFPFRIEIVGNTVRLDGRPVATLLASEKEEVLKNIFDKVDDILYTEFMEQHQKEFNGKMKCNTYTTKTEGPVNGH